MVMWLNVPLPPCFKGTVMKNVLQSLEKTGSSFWRRDSRTHTCACLYRPACTERCWATFNKKRLFVPGTVVIPIIYWPLSNQLRVSSVSLCEYFQFASQKPPTAHTHTQNDALTTWSSHFSDVITCFCRTRKTKNTSVLMLTCCAEARTLLHNNRLTFVHSLAVTSHNERIDVFWARFTHRTLSIFSVTHFTMVM